MILISVAGISVFFALILNKICRDLDAENRRLKKENNEKAMKIINLKRENSGIQRGDDKPIRITPEELEL